tara:strand:- start:2773 stop:3597 length:825 start_codon:yes stop_codon:yes gene_type:complete
MQPKLLSNGLNEIYENYDAFFIDLWGVIHNGVQLIKSANDVLDHLRKRNKRFVLMSNAPRPKTSVAKYLRSLGFKNEYMENVYTSGDAALSALEQNKLGKYFFHLGPKKDEDLFMRFIQFKKKNIRESDFILCTGLDENNETDLKYYEKFLNEHLSKKMLCTNPDLAVYRGNKKEYCAGSVAKIFENLGGEVVYFGKPYKDIYNDCAKKNEKILVIGDNLNTDIRGANNMNYDSLLIVDGIHKNEFKKIDLSNVQTIFSKYNVTANFIQKKLEW